MTSRTLTAGVRIPPYSEADFWVLERTLGDQTQTTHLGGPDSKERLENRHRKFVALSADPHAGCIFVIMIGMQNDTAGTVGYWERDFDGEKVWETGWTVLPEFQRRGIATAATGLLIEQLTKLRGYRYLYAYPSVDNHPSNAICRKLGFSLLESSNFEYYPGNILHCNIWRLDLSPSATGRETS